MALLLSACGREPSESTEPMDTRAVEAGDLVDEAGPRGVDFFNLSGRPEKATILEAGGAGVALLDLESDGDLDLVFAQGLASLDDLLAGPGADLEPFRNDGSGNFERQPGPGLSGWWTGLASGDLDGDGDADLVAGAYGNLQVLLQAPDGQLVPHGDLARDLGWNTIEPGAERQAGVAPHWITSLALFDADRDGRLDLYVGRYLDLDPVDPPRGALGEGELALPCRWKGHDVYCGPRGMVAQEDRLLMGSGDGGFSDQSEARLPAHTAGYTLAVLPFDADGDGDADLAVACDSSANRLFINDGRGHFAERGWESGFALGMEGQVEAGMGLAAGDVDRDGNLDLALTNFSDEPTALFLAADRGFTNATFRAGLGRESRDLLSWGVHLTDFDGDGHLDLFSANGHVYPQADQGSSGTSYAQPDTLWSFGPALKLNPVLPHSPHSLMALESGSRGSAVGDLDGDGAPDLVVSTLDGPARVGINHFPETRRLEVRCFGPEAGKGQGTGSEARTPPDAMGTRVVVVVEVGGEEVGLLSEVGTAVGYQSASTPWLHFGLKDAQQFRTMIVQWPSGHIDRLPGGPAQRRLYVREGQGVFRKELLP